MKKQISILLIASQITMAAAFGANNGAQTTQTTTAEFNMLRSVFALQGEKLTDEARNARIAGILDIYSKTAEKDGREQRLQTALVQLGVYTEAQAQSFIAESQTADASVRATQVTAAGETRDELSKQVTQLAQLHPMGAQFSACQAGEVLASAGVVTAIVGLILRYDNPSCYSQYQGTGYDCYFDQYGNYWCQGTDYYTEVCTQSDFYPHRSLGNGLLIGGGIAAAVGAVLMLTQSNGC